MAAAATLTWPAARLPQAMELLAGFAFGRSGRSTPVRRPVAAGDASVDQYARSFDLEIDTASVRYADVERVLRWAGPAVLALPDDAETAFLVLLSSSGSELRLVSPAGRIVRVPLQTVAGWLRSRVEAECEGEVAAVLDGIRIGAARRDRARKGILAAKLNETAVGRCWMLKPSPAAPLRVHLADTRLLRRIWAFLLAYAASVAVSLAAWWLIGSAALEGRFNAGTLLAWSFLLLSVVPLAVVALWSQGILMLGLGGILKQRLLAGAQRLEPDAVRQQGVGYHLSRVLESEAVEALALSGSFVALAAVVDGIAAGILLALAGHWLLLASLVGWAGLLGAGLAVYSRRRSDWTALRMNLTRDLVERMAGHRTRLVQEDPLRRHEEEDQVHAAYVAASKRMDVATALLSAAPRLWMILGICALTPMFLAGTPTTATVAIGVGLVLMIAGAASKLVTSYALLCDAGISWRCVRPLLEALSRAEVAGQTDAVARLGDRQARQKRPVVTAQDLTFRFSQRLDAVLHGCTFRIFPGDRIRLTGASGGGKSTLVSLLAGVRRPDGGLLLLDGLDLATLGDRGWHRRVAAAPQFHENHLFTDTLAFNLLLGRRWPPTDEDLRWAEKVCRQLGLGELLDRMPAGIFEVVGDGGWQLSHGERSRVFMARALLQGADLVIMDESVAELDPESLLACLPEAARLSRTLLVVGHD